MLTEARRRIRDGRTTRTALDELNDLAGEIAGTVTHGHLAGFGALLHRAWTLKKQMGSKVTNGELDRYYRLALRAGAAGGKISGAGGGGCLLLFAARRYHPAIRRMACRHGLKEIPISLEPDGSRIIYCA